MNEKLSVDVKGFAEALDIEESTAYGFLRLLAEKGIVETSKRPQPNGKKGKPATLYLLGADVGPKLSSLLTEKIRQLNVEKPAEATTAGVITAVVESSL